MFWLKKYISKQNLSHSAIDLFIHHFLRLVGTNLVGIFGPIFLFIIFEDIKISIIYYLFFYIFYYIGLPAAMKVVNKVGFKQSMFYSLPLLALCYLSFYKLTDTTTPWFWFSAALFFQIIQSYLYWIPYHTDFTLLTKPQSRGRSLALLTGALTTTFIVIPFISSLVISYFGYVWLFLLSIFFILVSSFYLRRVPDIKEEYSYGYIQTYKELFKSRNRRMFIAYFSDGIQSVIGFVIWPMFIFLLLNNNYLSVGIISSLIVLMTVAMRFVVGGYADRMAKTKLVKFTSIFHSIGWLLKSFVNTPFQIFVVGSYHDFTGSATRISFDSLMYERAADNGHYMDEYTVLRDIALTMGRSFALLAALFIFPWLGLQWTFLIAAIFSLFLGII